MKDIKILGPGCAKCKMLEEQTQLAATELGLDCQIEKVQDIQEIITYGVMMTPALLVDGEVKAMGRVPTLEDIKKLLAP